MYSTVAIAFPAYIGRWNEDGERMAVTSVMGCRRRSAAARGRTFLVAVLDGITHAVYSLLHMLTFLVAVLDGMALAVHSLLHMLTFLVAVFDGMALAVHSLLHVFTLHRTRWDCVEQTLCGLRMENLC